LACATTLARAGVRVTVLEKKADPGEKLHTTGIIVKEAIDQIRSRGNRGRHSYCAQARLGGGACNLRLSKWQK
jgi:flavin-dependent dehydrogenase